MKYKDIYATFSSYKFIENITDNLYVIYQEKGEDGKFLNKTAVIVFCAFTIEAFLNQVGDSLFGSKFWKENLENLSPKQKIEIIQKELNLPTKWGENPFQTLAIIFDFRNLVAHGKYDEVLDGKSNVPPEAKWDKLLKKIKLDKCISSVESFIENIIQANKMLPYRDKFEGDIRGYTKVDG